MSPPFVHFYNMVVMYTYIQISLNYLTFQIIWVGLYSAARQEHRAVADLNGGGGGVLNIGFILALFQETLNFRRRICTHCSDYSHKYRCIAITA
jgi:hypothetical protein